MESVMGGGQPPATRQYNRVKGFSGPGLRASPEHNRTHICVCGTFWAECSLNGPHTRAAVTAASTVPPARPWARESIDMYTYTLTHMHAFISELETQEGCSLLVALSELRARERERE